MSDLPENIHPVFDAVLGRDEKERALRQRARVIWLYGLSGSGKSTLATALERALHARGFTTHVLDGDNVRSGLNGDLGFSDADRAENIRRAAETAKLFLDAGLILIASFITPTNALRTLARDIIGAEDFIEVYVRCSFETCEKRDVKGLYAKSKSGALPQFTGRDAAFEEPESPSLTLDTETMDVEAAPNRLRKYALPKILLP